MQDYSKLVEALRGCKDIDYCTDCPRMENGYNETCNIKDDAADAIEALQAENPIVETVLLDKMRQQMEENVCHCNVKENAELIARILDDDVDGKTFKMAKRNAELHAELERWVSAAEMAGLVVRCKECIHFAQGGWCDREFDWFPVDENDFCSMAEKMEVQE